MRLVSFLALTILTCCPYAQTRYRILLMGREMGEAQISHKVLPSGGLKAVVHMRFDGPDGAIRISIEEVTKPDGTPEKMSIQETFRGAKSSHVETYGPSGVTLTRTENGKTTTKKIAYPKRGNRKSTSVFWFIKVRPKVGEKDTSISFDSDTLAWESTDDTYVGIRSIIIKGKSVKAHCIVARDYKAWVDDRGVEYAFEFTEDGQKVRLERK